MSDLQGKPNDVDGASIQSIVHSPMLSWQVHCVAREDWIKERWGGFTYLVIGRNEDFMLDFQDGSLWLHYESDARNSPVGRLLLFATPSRQNVMDAEQMFGCK